MFKCYVYFVSKCDYNVKHCTLKCYSVLNHSHYYKKKIFILTFLYVFIQFIDIYSNTEGINLSIHPLALFISCYILNVNSLWVN